MTLLHTLQKRYTTKAYDGARRIPDETIAQLLEALRLSPSSVNSQPWHFIIADDNAGKERIAKATPEQSPLAYNRPKITGASHAVLLCARQELSDAYLTTLLEKEREDGRFVTEEAFATRKKTLTHYVGLHRQAGNLEQWTQKQVYIAQGFLLLSAASMGIDATPIEGFDPTIMSEEFDLAQQKLTPLVVIALGYHSEEDSNAKRPKSRLAYEAVFSKA
ncbi:oxygen-insensitive NAD(P)H nitroreductase [Saccharibacter floricola]|uniref:NADH/NADPH nitroreductase n=1 Tax=Saccharibacter floricola DSM 15669 TaxID=1123227 RepID=A0ABQ0P0P4_9PROT|nr:oxygen-insensitive NAD(P)H nitroreductase [Saccharibacter floricola]GBQ08370.1 NADH/NADPH nitroreductase [Saccharibacter floricola DSM 15669]